MRQKMAIEQVLDARQNFWQNFANQITLEIAETDTIQEYPVALTRLIWQNEPEEKRYVIREAVIQQEKDRYFLRANVINWVFIWSLYILLNHLILLSMLFCIKTKKINKIHFGQLNQCLR